MKPGHLIIPSTPLARRFGDIFHRRHTTGWNQREVAAFKRIFTSINFSDLAKVERRYRSLYPPDRTKNSLRHDLETLLNHWPGEVDRANAWCDANPEKRERKVIQMPPRKSEPEHYSQEELEGIERFNAERKLKGKPSAFAKAREAMGK